MTKTKQGSQWLYRIQPARPEMLCGERTEEEGQLVQKHYDYLCGLVENGVVVLAGRSNTCTDCTVVPEFPRFDW